MIARRVSWPFSSLLSAGVSLAGFFRVRALPLDKPTDGLYIYRLSVGKNCRLLHSGKGSAMAQQKQRSDDERGRDRLCGAWAGAGGPIRARRLPQQPLL